MLNLKVKHSVCRSNAATQLCVVSALGINFITQCYATNYNACDTFDSMRCFLNIASVSQNIFWRKIYELTKTTDKC